jgi:organic radical activating enzyme
MLVNRKMDKSPTYCVLPHLGMALQNHSDFCVCNSNKASWKDNNRQVMHVNTHPIHLTFQSYTRKMVGTALDHGIKHDSCQHCWDLESVSGISPRQIYNQLFAGVEALPDQPRVLIMKPGNTCNFACRMCNPVTSSSWYADGYDLERSGLSSSSWYDENHQNHSNQISFNEYTRSFENIRNSFNRDNTEFWNTLKAWMQGLVFIDIYGGEPFLIPAMFDLLEHGVKTGASKNIILSLHTNASIFNQHYLEILSQYKEVRFNISLDSDDPAQLEYIRHRAKFDQIVENCIKFKKFFEQHPKVKMAISCTVTPFNIFYLNAITTNLNHRFDLPVNVNLVTTPEYDIRHLPQPVKNLLSTTLQNTPARNFLQQTIPGCDIEWPKFCRATDRLDHLRQQSFAETFPDWWNILKSYWVI